MSQPLQYNELRRDPILGRWIIVDTTRPRLPESVLRKDYQDEITEPQNCPFCPGNEKLTPHEIMAQRQPGTAPDSPGWSVRVFPSIHPLLRIEGEPERAAVEMYDMHLGVGAHEVIVETPEHNLQLCSLPDEQVESVLWTYRDRILDLHKDHRLRYVLIFKNKGYAAGATISHSHSQLIATPVTPRTVRQELEGSRKYFNFNNRERCVWCDMIKTELDLEQRIVLVTKNIIAFCPYSSRFPFETWVLPLNHSHDFTHLGKTEATDLASVLKNILGRMNRALNNSPYNFVIHTAPNLASRSGHWTTIAGDFHWHFEIIPRLTRVMGFEWGTGFYVNPTPPEMAAGILRNA